jgi:hypothetical protein
MAWSNERMRGWLTIFCLSRQFSSVFIKAMPLSPKPDGLCPLSPWSCKDKVHLSEVNASQANRQRPEWQRQRKIASVSSA